MIRMAFCDDEAAELEQLGTLTKQYCEERKRELDYAVFQSPLDLLAEIERGIRYDILLLDVLMPGETGLDAAAEIRKYDSNVKIIFLTSSAEYAVESYRVEAYYYQLKPICKERFSDLMDSVLSTCEEEQTNSILLQCRSGSIRVALKRLEYCEVLHHTLYIHLTSGDVLESVGSLDELCRQLAAYGNFCRPHRSYMINLDYVRQLSYRGITMSGMAVIPIPRGKYNEIKEAYLEYAFQNRQVIV